MVGLWNPDGSQVSLTGNFIKSVVSPNTNNKIIYFGDSFVGRSLGANGLSGNIPSLSGFPFWVQFLTAGKMNLFGILGFSGYTTVPFPGNNPGLTAMVVQFAQYLQQADYIFAEGGINDAAIATTLTQRIQNLETYWAELLSLGPQLIVPTINPNWETGTTETIQQYSQIIAMNDYIIKQGKKGRFLVADIYKRLTISDGSFTGNLRANASAIVTGPPHLSVLGTYYYARAISDDVINQLPGLTPAPRGNQETLNPYIINNNSILSGNVASGTANTNTTITTLTGTGPYQWTAGIYGSGVAGSCIVTTVDDQISGGNVPVLGDVSFAQWSFSFTATTANTGIQITQTFGMVNGHTFGPSNTIPSYYQGYFWMFQNGNTYKGLVPFGTYLVSGSNSMTNASTTIGEITNDGVINWQTLPPITPGTVVQVSVRMQFLTNPLNVPMQLNLSLAVDSSATTHQAFLSILNCGQEVPFGTTGNAYIATGMAQGLDYPDDYWPFGTGEEFLIQSLPIVLRDPSGNGTNLETMTPQLLVLASTPSASAITFAIRDFEVRVIGQKPIASGPITYY